MEGPRPVQPHEIDSLFELLAAVFKGHNVHMREAFPLLFESPNWQNLFVMADGGRIVSHVGMRFDDTMILGCRLKVASIGSVATYEGTRNALPGGGRGQSDKRWRVGDAYLGIERAVRAIRRGEGRQVVRIHICARGRGRDRRA